MIQELIHLFEWQPDLKRSFEDVLANMGEDSYWYEKTLSDLYDFFEEWRTFCPGHANCLSYIDKFARLYRARGNGHGGKIIEAGIRAVRDPRFSRWMEKFVKARGEFLDSRESAYIVETWLSDGLVDIEDCRVPSEGFTSFNQFFTRSLCEGARPIAAPDDRAALVSPADCELWKFPAPLTAKTNLEVKGQDYDVASLLGESPLAERFEGGSALFCFLMPNYYHRFHAPISGKIIAAQQLGGLYFGARGFISHFFEYRRGFYIVDLGEGMGLLALVAIGNATIASVNFTCKVGQSIGKGEEIGYFAYGGSIIAMLFEADLFELLPNISKSPMCRGQRQKASVRVGDLLGHLKLTA